MRKVLATALALMATLGAATAQESVVLEKKTLPLEQGVGPVFAQPWTPSSAIEQRYVWFSRHFVYDTTVNGRQTDWNIMNFGIPAQLGRNSANQEVELRGAGQIFAPGVFYDFFMPEYTGPYTDKLQFDQSYIEQFQDAQQFTIDTIVVRYFKNPRQTDQAFSAKFYVWKTPSDFAGNSYWRNAGGYQRNGVAFSRSRLREAFSTELQLDGFDTTLLIQENPQNPGQMDTLINAITYAFDTPLEFAAGEAAIAMFVNDEAPALASPILGPTNTSEFQVVRGFFENIEGRRNRLTNFKAFGATLYRTVLGAGNNADSIVTTWSTLVYGQAPDTVPAVIDFSYTFGGTVELSSGVTYRFGTDASSQGITAVSPNPAREHARIDFQLKELGQVSLELYDPQGRLVRTMVQERFVPGIYSYDLKTDDLTNGTYLVRLMVGEKAYSQKVNVVK